MDKLKSKKDLSSVDLIEWLQKQAYAKVSNYKFKSWSDYLCLITKIRELAENE
jgi:hypothetical protein